MAWRMIPSIPSRCSLWMVIRGADALVPGQESERFGSILARFVASCFEGFVKNNRSEFDGKVASNRAGIRLS